MGNPARPTRRVTPSPSAAESQLFAGGVATLGIVEAATREAETHSSAQV